MESVHNPDRFMSDLRQILSQDRKRVGLLIGAGAPISIRIGADGKLDPDGDPLIPGVDELTKQVVGNLDEAEQATIKILLAEVGAEIAPAKPNIENLLSRIRLLQNAIGKSKVHDVDAEGYKQLGIKVCKQIGQKVGVDLPKERCCYNELVSWISGTQRQRSIEIFTTNYDRLFEEAFEAARASYFDGFSGGSMPFFDPATVAGDDLPARWSRLWKLHGSLGWSIESGSVVRTGSKNATELVFPDHLKYDLTQKQPYSALFERLRQFLLTPDTLLLAVGFSFRDAHIGAVIDECLAMNANASVFAFQFLSLDQEECARTIALNHPNMSVYASDGAVISGVEGKWRLGDPPKNWIDIRSSFWGPRYNSEESVFLLGDFAQFSRFCALSQAAEMRKPPLSDGDLAKIIETLHNEAEEVA